MVLPIKHRLKRPLQLALLSILGLPTAAWAQAAPTGDGLQGDYYDGPNFERLILSRHDATIDFNWTHLPPAPGLPAEHFSVRWTGWLVPPASGRYLFHVNVDDGIRIWLNDKLILNEWRPQWVSNFTVAAELKAGEPYRLRVEYFQDILDTRAHLTWERPDVPLAPPPASWRNLWGMNAETPKPGPIPTRFLFSRNPKPVAANDAIPKPLQPQLPKPAPARVVVVPPTVVPARRTAPAPAPRLPRRPVASLTPAPASATVPLVPLPVPSLLLADSGSTAQLTRLAVGETVTLPELYFEQGQARLLPTVRTALDALAATLQARPEMRFEVQGHTDNVGNAGLNRQLSQQRAEAVCRYLTAHGVATAQLHPKGFGGTQPVADNADPAQRPRNRRVVLLRL